MSPLTRRRLLRTGGALGAGVLAGCSSLGLGTAGSSGPSWPQYQADAGNTGVSSAASIPTEPVETDWSLDVDAMGSLPAVAGEKGLYTATIHEADDGPPTAAELRVRCHALGDGTERWRTTLETTARNRATATSVALTEQAVLVATRPPDSEGSLVALDREDGSVGWESASVADVYPHDGVVYGAGRVAEAGASTPLVGLDPDDGATVWEATVGESYVAVPGSGSVGVAGGVLVTHVVDEDRARHLAAWDLDGGDRVWVTEAIADSLGGLPLATTGDVAVTVGAATPDSTEFVGVDVANGSVRWRHEIDAAWAGGPTLLDGRAYVMSREDREPDATVRLHALDLDGGSLQYTTDLPGSPFGHPISDGDRLLVDGDEITVLDPADGTQLWSDRPSGTDREFGLVVPADGALVGTRGGKGDWTTFR